MPAFETGIVFKLVGSKRLILDEESSYHDGHQTRPQDKEFNNWWFIESEIAKKLAFSTSNVLT